MRTINFIMFFLVVSLHAKSIEIKGLLVDFAENPVSMADVLIEDDLNVIRQTVTGENGIFSLEFQVPDSVSGIESNDVLKKDWLNGTSYHLASSSGQLVIFNILGQKVIELPYTQGIILINLLTSFQLENI